jgi:hypothetical protein
VKSIAKLFAPPAQRTVASRSEDTSAPSIAQRLPVEIWHEILAQPSIEPADLLRAEGVCRSARTAARAPALWKEKAGALVPNNTPNVRQFFIDKSFSPLKFAYLQLRKEAIFGAPANASESHWVLFSEAYATTRLQQRKDRTSKKAAGETLADIGRDIMLSAIAGQDNLILLELSLKIHGALQKGQSLDDLRRDHSFVDKKTFDQTIRRAKKDWRVAI